MAHQKTTGELPQVSAVQGMDLIKILHSADGRNFQAVDNDSVCRVDQLVISGVAPAAANSPGVPGQRAFDATHLYLCVAPNSWIRFIGTTW